MNLKNEEEVLDFMTRLLERLHQAGFNQQGSHYQFVYVQAYACPMTHPQPHSRAELAYPSPLPSGRGADAFKGNESFSDTSRGRLRHCIALLMQERYGDEPLFCQQSHWQAVYRILVDKGYCRDSDFDGFDAFIRTVMPEEVNKPYKKDSVRNINKTDFNKPFVRWHYDPVTSGTRKPFERMVAVASRFKEILKENGL